MSVRVAGCTRRDDLTFLTRRRPHVLLLVIGAAAALLLSAPALGAGVLTTEQVAITGGGVQQSPAIAVDPDAPLTAPPSSRTTGPAAARSRAP